MMGPKVLISLTTISSRMPSLDKVIFSLLKQNYSNFEVRLHISNEPYLLDKGVDEIPSSLQQIRAENDNFSIVFCENSGPYRKLIPALEEFWGSDQLIMTVDDDVLYPEEALYTLVEAEKIFNCPVAFRGRRLNYNAEGILPYRQWLKTGQAGESTCNVPTGKDGVLYRANHFGDGVLDISKAKEVAKTTDDLWFKWFTHKNDLPSVILFDSLAESFDVVESESPEITLFDSFNSHGANDEVVSKLENYFSTSFGKSLYQGISS